MKRNAKIGNIIKISLMALIVISLSVAMLWSGTLAERTRKKTSDFSKGWSTDSGDIVNLDDISTTDFGGTFRLTKRLPKELRHSDALCFISYNSSIAVSIDDEVIYSYDQTENFTGKGYGIAYHAANLCHDYCGKDIVLEIGPVFDSRRGGQIRSLSLEAQDVYQSRVASGQLVAFNISTGIAILGIIILIVGLLEKKKEDRFSAIMLSVSSLMAGVWLANDTGFLRLVFNAVRVGRVVDYVLMYIWLLPLMMFIWSITRLKKVIFRNLAIIGSLVFYASILARRFLLGQDMTRMVGMMVVYFVAMFCLSVGMLTCDYLYCRRNKIETRLRLFFIGLSVLTVTIVIDLCIYGSGVRSVIGRGYFVRMGFLTFFVLMGMSVLERTAKERAKMKRDRFINKMLQYAISVNDPDVSIRAIMEYVGKEFSAEHVFIYENRHDGTFHNTYEWFEKNAPDPGSQDYHDLPYEGFIDELLAVFKREHRLIIDKFDNVDKYGAKLSELLSTINVRRIVVGPLEYDGELIGIFGVDDAPSENSTEIADVIWLLSYVITQLLVQRNEKRNLVRYSYFDSLTGTRNRRALDEFETEKAGLVPYGYVMLDINGLKQVNDRKGHDAGDKMITDISDSLIDVFGEYAVFRIGGDEFVAYSFADSKEEFTAQVEETRRRLREKGRSASMGAVYVTDASIPRSEVREKADALMYEDKERFYKGKNDRRR